MAQNETARATVYLDGKQAEAALEALDRKSKELKKDLTSALQAGDNVKFDKLKKELSTIEATQRSLKRETFDVERVLKNINNVSWRDLQKAQSTITNQLKGMTRGTEEYLKKCEELKKVKTALADINAETRTTSKSWSLSGLADGFNRYLGVVMAVIASFTGLALGFKQVVQSFNDFQERVSNLSALTGLKGGALDWLTQKAKDLSIATLDGGIKIKKGAQDIVDGFTKMGSARPELLKNKEALAQVTEKALILAEASKIEMVPAIDAVAAAMNQFNLDASQSDRIINAIAAGSLEGSAEVADLTESLKNVGTVAADSNMSLEQTVAALEVLGEKQLKGAEAGTKLRGALLKMKDAGVGYASGQFNIRDALIEVNAQLEKKTLASEKDALKQKVFGIENITVGSVLLQNVEKYDKLTTAVTGTNVAMVQAATNTDNNNARLAQAKNRINIISIELGEKLAPAMATITGWYGKMLSVTIVLVNFFTKYGAAIVSVTATIAAYTAIVKIADMWDTIHYGFLVAKTAVTTAYTYVVNVLTGRITLATVAQNAWNLAQKLNPIGLIVGFLVAAGAALYLYTREMTAAEIAQKALNDIGQKAKQSISDERVEMEQLLRVAQNELLSKETRKTAIEKLNKLSPEYLGGLSLETINTKAATLATDQYIASLLRKAELEAATENLKEVNKEIGKLESGDVDPGFGQNALGILKHPTMSWEDVKATTKKENIAKQLPVKKLEAKVYQDKIDSLVNSASVITTNSPSGSGGGNGSGGGGGETDDEKKAREKAEKEAKKTEKELSKTANDELKAAYEDRLLIIKTSYQNEGWTKEEYQVKMNIAEIAYLSAQKELLKSQGKDTTEVEIQIAEARIKIQEDAYNVIEDIAKTYDEQAKKQQETVVSQIEETIKSVDDSLAALKELEKEEKEINENRAKSYLDLAGSVGDSFADTLMSQEQDFGQFLRNTLVMALDALEKMLILSIAETTIKDVATKGFVGMATAIAKIVLLKAAFGTAKALVLGGGKGKQSGGYADSDSNDSTPVGVYHANEFIASGPAVRNPTIKPVLDIIDIAQRSGTIRTLNLPAMLGQSGKQSGGYASAGSTSSPATNSIQPNTKLESAIDRLISILDKGIDAKVSKYGRGSLSDALKDIENFNKKK